MSQGLLKTCDWPLLSGIALLLSLLGPPGYAQTPANGSQSQEGAENSSESGFDFVADELEYDREMGILKAIGNVEIIYEERVLKADIITYNEKTDVMAASGNVSLLEPSGDVVFAEYVEMTSDLKQGVIQRMLIVLSDNSRIAANSGKREDGNRTEMSRAIYTACSLCEEDPSRPPLWQIKAVEVIHDQEEQTIEYKDAWVEMGGIPVAYSPYIIHPDPTVKRRSGFLVPSFGSDSELGTVIKTPYFWAISDNSDATITPIYASSEGPALFTEIRHRMRKGEFNLEGSVADQDDSDDDAAAHIDASLRYHFDKTWRGGLDAQRTSEDTYLRRYGYDFDQTLTSRGFLEGFRGRNYLVANTYAFQSLEDDVDDDEIPYVLPLLDYQHIGQPDALGGYTELNANVQSLVREQGNDTQRVSVHGGWNLPLMGPLGTTVKLNAMLRSDLYYKTDFIADDSSDEEDGFEYRLIPEASIDVRYPFVKQDGAFTQTLEPQVQFIVSPYGGNDNDIPNDDSLGFELDETRLFSSSRFAGFDKVEEGPRFNYGMRWGVSGPSGGSTTAFLGQSYRFKEQDEFGAGTGLEDKFSDFVGTIHVAPGDLIDIFYRTRVDQANLTFETNEVAATVGKPLLTTRVIYSFFDEQPSADLEAREEIRYEVSSQFSENYSGTLSGTNDIDDGGSLRRLSASLAYEDECFIFETTAVRSFFEDRDLRPTDSIIFRIALKTLGEFSTSPSI